MEAVDTMIVIYRIFLEFSIEITLYRHNQRYIFSKDVINYYHVNQCKQQLVY